MAEGSGGALWFGAPGFTTLAVIEHGDELVVEVETSARVVGCHRCGVRAVAKDRRWVTLRDAPHGDRPVIVRWRKRIWKCVDVDCDVRSWTEQRPDLVDGRRVLTARAGRWVCARVRALEGTPASCARRLGVTWSTAWSAVVEHATALIDDPGRIGVTTAVGFDETVMAPARRLRRRRFVTCSVDVDTGQILDVFEGRNAADLRAWLAHQPSWWRFGLEVISVDPHEGYRSAIVANPLLPAVKIVVDPFHIVRLANQAVTRCRQRVQQATFGHRGHRHDPLYGIRKLLLMAVEHVDEAGWTRIWAALRDGDPDGDVQDAWVAKEYVRDIYLTDDPELARAALDRAIAWCTTPGASKELRTLAKTLKRWRTEILAHHDTGASNGKVEAANLLIKNVKRSGRGFRNLANYRLRILLAGGLPRETHTVTRIRARPRFIA